MGLFGGNDESELSKVKIPNFFEDPMYQSSQETLSKTGTDLLAGHPNDYYRPIGESNSLEFQELMKSISGDIMGGVTEKMARQNTGRGGIAAAATAEAMNKTMPAMRYQDLMNSIEGKKFLLGKGLDTTSGVRSSALSFGSQKNQFNLSKTGLEMDQASAADEAEAAENAAWSKMLQTGIGAIGTILAPATGGASLAMTAASTLGSAKGGGGIKDLDTGSGGNLGRGTDWDIPMGLRSN